MQELAPTSRYTGLKHHAKVHSFRIATALLACGAAFYYRPDLIKHAFRIATRAIEGVGDTGASPSSHQVISQTQIRVRGIRKALPAKTDLLTGQYKTPVRVVAERWSEDVSEDVAQEIRRRCNYRCANLLPQSLILSSGRGRAGVNGRFGFSDPTPRQREPGKSLS